MTFDPVHDIQAGFRCLLEACSFPGRTVDLSEPASRLRPWIGEEGACPALALAAAALVDQDTSYSVGEGCGLGRFLADWTSSRPVGPEAAAYVVVTEPDGEALADILGLVSSGTLADPHLGATVLVGVPDLDAGQPWVLRGPGIESSVVRILPGGSGWVEVRNLRNREFPLGIDLVFIDRKGKALALPRTTVLSRKEA